MVFPPAPPQAGSPPRPMAPPQAGPPPGSGGQQAPPTPDQTKQVITKIIAQLRAMAEKANLDFDQLVAQSQGAVQGAPPSGGFPPASPQF